MPVGKVNILIYFFFGLFCLIYILYQKFKLAKVLIVIFMSLRVEWHVKDIIACKSFMKVVSSTKVQVIEKLSVGHGTDIWIMYQVSSNFHQLFYKRHFHVGDIIVSIVHGLFRRIPALLHSIYFISPCWSF